jgi:uncharacterized protein
VSPAQRPAPVVTAETRKFWEAAAQGQLVLAQCPLCGRIPYPPTSRCPKCLEASLEWGRLSGSVHLIGWTDLHLAANGLGPGPTTIVECALVEDLRAHMVAICRDGSVRNCAPDALAQIHFEKDPNGWSYPIVAAAGVAQGEAEA